MFSSNFKWEGALMLSSCNWKGGGLCVSGLKIIDVVEFKLQLAISVFGGSSEILQTFGV